MKAILTRAVNNTTMAITVTPANHAAQSTRCTKGPLAAAKALALKHYGQAAADTVEPCTDPESHTYAEAQRYQDKGSRTWEKFQFDPRAEVTRHQTDKRGLTWADLERVPEPIAGARYDLEGNSIIIREVSLKEIIYTIHLKSPVKTKKHRHDRFNFTRRAKATLVKGGTYHAPLQPTA